MSTIRNIASHISQKPRACLSVLEIHNEDEVFETFAFHFDRYGMTLLRSSARTQPGKSVWLEFKLEPMGEAIRALAEIKASEGNKILARFRHMWPKDERRYFQYLTRADAA